MATARPNKGTLLTAALMREGVVGCVLTLNYDMSIVHALSEVDAGNDVSILAGPEDHQRLGRTNLVFLHRNVYADAEDLIIRREQLESAWRDQWEHVVASRFLGGPATVFAGLGSPAAVLTETMHWIMGALKNVKPTLVDPSHFDGSQFAKDLGLSEDEYVRAPWSRFMELLSARVLVEHVRVLLGASDEFLQANRFPLEDLAGIAEQLQQLGLVECGRLRANWILSDSQYEPLRAVDPRLLADLICLVASVERRTVSRATLSPSGVVYFVTQTGTAPVVLATGGGIHRWATVEATLRHRYANAPFVAPGAPKPRFAVVAGVQGSQANIAPPIDIVGSFEHESVVSGPDVLELLDVDAVRNEDPLAMRLVS